MMTPAALSLATSDLTCPAQPPITTITHPALVSPSLIPGAGTTIPQSPEAHHITTQLPAHHITTQPPVYQLISDTVPPVPVQIRHKIIQGEFIDFSVLLHKATFPDTTANPRH